MLVVEEKERRAYYDAALRALRFVESKSPSKRRFGPEADAMWKSFRGHLTAADRIDMMLRDADIEAGGAYGARVAFGMRGVAEDDAFGAEWTPLRPVDADTLYRTVNGDPVESTVAGALAACARAWSIELSSLAEKAPRAAEKILVVGPSAVLAIGKHFDGETTLSFADQVTCIATPPAHRHVAALAAALLRSRKAPTILSSSDASAKARFDRIVIAPDAHPDDRAAAERLRTT